MDNNTLTEVGQGILTQYSPSLINDYIALSGAVLVFYDYLLTFHFELLLVWNGKANFMKMLFFVNRYAGIIAQYASIFQYFFKPASNTECSAFEYLNNIFSILSDTAIYSIFTLRTFAIYGKSWVVFFVLAIPLLGDVAANIWGVTAGTASAVPRQLQVGPWTCVGNTTPSAIDSDLTEAISAIVFDVLVVILTVYRTFRLVRDSRKANIRRSLSYILLRDGIIYYVAIFLPQLGYFALSAILLKDDTVNLSYLAGDADTVFLAFRNVSVNRLVFSLSYAANHRDDSEYRTRTGLEPPVFAGNSAFGNIGGLVRSDLDGFDKENEPETVENREEGNNDDRIMLDSQGNCAGSTVDGDVGGSNAGIAFRPNSVAEIEEINV